MEYAHTQRAPLSYLLIGLAAVLLGSAWFARAESIVALTLSASAALVLVFAFSFASLTIADAGQSLSIRFGPLPLFGRRIDYADITAVEPGRSSWIDGWGIHYVPGRGWTYNLWGFDCAVLRLGNRTVRIGTDDRDHLVHFLAETISSRGGGHQP